MEIDSRGSLAHRSSLDHSVSHQLNLTIPEAGLRNRGSLTVWISLTAGKLVNWDAPRPRRRKPGRQRKYSNHAIETAVTLGMVFHLSSRQSEGLLRSLFALMKLDNDVPDHTTISRRKAKLGKVPFYQDKQKTPLHILIDSSGLAVHAGQRRCCMNAGNSLIPLILRFCPKNVTC